MQLIILIIKIPLTHFVGIPLIVFSIMCLTARAGMTIGSFEITLAMVLILASIVYHLSLDRIFGVIMLSNLMPWLIHWHIKLHSLIWDLWLSLSIGIFVVGWAFQFVGHFYEKKKPAFMDDVIGLAIGPLFVLAEMVFMLGFKKRHRTTHVR